MADSHWLDDLIADHYNDVPIPNVRPQLGAGWKGEPQTGSTWEDLPEAKAGLNFLAASMAGPFVRPAAKVLFGLGKAESAGMGAAKPLAENALEVAGKKSASNLVSALGYDAEQPLASYTPQIAQRFKDVNAFLAKNANKLSPEGLAGAQEELKLTGRALNLLQGQ